MKPDQESIKSDYCAGQLSIKAVADKHGIAKTTLIDLARRNEWVREKPTKKADQKKRSENKTVGRSEKKPSATRRRGDADQKKEPAISPPAKPIRGSRTDPPTNQFQRGNQTAFKHGGYAARMLLPDDVISDANQSELQDELFQLRARNMVAASTIGQLTEELEWVTDDERESLESRINGAYKAMDRNTARMESIENTLATVAYRIAAREKLVMETDKLRRDAGLDDGNGDKDLGDFYADVEQSDAGDEAYPESGTPAVLDDEST